MQYDFEEVLKFKNGFTDWDNFKGEIRDHLIRYYSNEEHVNQVLNALKTPPDSSIRVNTLKHTEDFLGRLQSYLKETNQIFSPEQHSTLKDCLVVRNSSPNWNLTPIHPEIVVDLQCGASVLRGSDIYAPGVLGAAAGIQSNEKVSVFVDIDHKVNRGRMRDYSGRMLYIGNGITLMSRSAFYLAKSGVAIKMTEKIWDCPSLNDLAPDLFYLQNVPSMVVSHVLDPQPGELICDMCSAPGGKTTHIAMLMKNQGKVIAVERIKSKKKQIDELCKVHGITCVETYSFDSTKLLDNDEKYKNIFKIGSFDKVLLDPPCSGLGLRPCIYNTMTLSALNSYSPYQRKLFHVAVQLVKPNGTLVYSTCTINPEECEEIVAWALMTFPNLELTEQLPYLGSPGLVYPNEVGLSLTTEQAKLVQRFEPQNGTNGFFIAKFKKK